MYVAQRRVYDDDIIVVTHIHHPKREPEKEREQEGTGERAEGTFLMGVRETDIRVGRRREA